MNTFARDEAVGIKSRMRITLMNPISLAAPAGPYSHLVQVPAGAGLIFASGQVPVGLDGYLRASLAEQADQVYANVVTALASVDTPPSSIIKLTTFMVEDDPERVVSKARSKYLGDHRPASTVVWVTRLVDPLWKIEIEAIALFNG